LLTCKHFLAELTDYLDEKTDADLRANLEKHMTECPDCFVVCDTTRKTIAVYKGHEKQCCIPADVQSRLMEAVERKIGDKKRSQSAD
jgi:anti-sigma factor RsiW